MTSDERIAVKSRCLPVEPQSHVESVTAGRGAGLGAWVLSTMPMLNDSALREVWFRSVDPWETLIAIIRNNL